MLAGAEVNHGAAPNLQLHVIVPLASNDVQGSSTQVGIGDIELGVKYRFPTPGEKDWYPQVAIFPLVELATSNSDRGLGAGKTRVYSPSANAAEGENASLGLTTGSGSAKRRPRRCGTQGSSYCWHGDALSKAQSLLRAYGHDVVQVAEPPRGTTPPQALIEFDIARDCWDAAFEKRARNTPPPVGSARAAPAMRPAVADHGEIWIMVMATIASARLTGQESGWAASRRRGGNKLSSPAP